MAVDPFFSSFFVNISLFSLLNHEEKVEPNMWRGHGMIPNKLAQKKVGRENPDLSHLPHSLFIFFLEPPPLLLSSFQLL